jgi:hypothetical protein
MAEIGAVSVCACSHALTLANTKIAGGYAPLQRASNKKRTSVVELTARKAADWLCKNLQAES